MNQEDINKKAAATIVLDFKLDKRTDIGYQRAIKGIFSCEVGTMKAIDGTGWKWMVTLPGLHRPLIAGEADDEAEAKLMCQWSLYLISTFKPAGMIPTDGSNGHQPGNAP